MILAPCRFILLFTATLSVFAACSGSDGEERTTATQAPATGVQPGQPNATSATLPPLTDLMAVSKLKLRTEISSALEKHNFTYDKTTPQGSETSYTFIRAGGDNINFVTNNADRSMVEYTTANQQLVPVYKAEVAKLGLKAIDCQINGPGLTVHCFENSDYYIIIAQKTMQQSNSQPTEIYSIMVNH